MNTQQNVNLSIVIKELHKAFDCFNNTIFNGELPQVIITIQSKGKRSALGWFTCGKVWDDGTQDKHEINISAEYTDRDFMDIMRTLLHEMIHLYCAEHDIKDCSRGGTYHNKNFRAISERYGFYYPEDSFDKKYGWSFSELTDETKKQIEGFGIDKSVFSLKRADMSENTDGTKKKSNIIKWQCPCGNIIRSSKAGLNIICGDCMEHYEIVED